MIWKKSIFSYILWLLYAAGAAAGLITFLDVFCREFSYPEWVEYAACGVLVLMGLPLMLIFRGQSDGQADEYRKSDSILPHIAEGAAVVILLSLGMVIRIAGISSAGEDSIYYEYARVADKAAEGSAIPQIVHGISYLYLRILHLLFVILGNKIMAGYWLQVILQFLAVIMFYFAVRRLSGVIPAVSMLLFTSLSPYIKEEALTLSPRILFFLLYGLVLWIIVICLDRKKGSAAGGLIAGILTGLLTYLDIMGITLLLFVTGIFLLSGESVKIRRKVTGVLLSLAGAVLGAGAAVFVDAVFSGKKFMSIVRALGTLYEPKQSLLSKEVIHSFVWPPEALRFDIMLLIFMIALGVFCFWCNRRSDETGIWILTALPVILMSCMQITVFKEDGYFWIYIFMTVLAGVGVSNVLRAALPASLRGGEYGEDYYEAAFWNSIEKDYGAPFQSDETDQYLQKKMEDTGLGAKTENNTEASGREESDNMITVNVEGKTREIRLLDNPLPLPKKHTRKTMDYDYDVADDDDFDI